MTVSTPSPSHYHYNCLPLDQLLKVVVVENSPDLAGCNLSQDALNPCARLELLSFLLGHLFQRVNPHFSSSVIYIPVTRVSNVMGGRLYMILLGKRSVPTVLEGPPLIRGGSLFCGGWEGGDSSPLTHRKRGICSLFCGGGAAKQGPTPYKGWALQLKTNSPPSPPFRHLSMFIAVVTAMVMYRNLTDLFSTDPTGGMDDNYEV